MTDQCAAVIEAASGCGSRAGEGPGDQPGGPDTNASMGLEAVVREYQRPLLRYAMQLLPDRPDQAQDVVQEAFIRYRKARNNGTSVRRVSSWLYRVTHNLAVDLNRRENRLCELDETMLNGGGSCVAEMTAEMAPGATLCRREARELAVAELRRLPDEDRQVLLLKVIQGMTLREVSETTGVNINTVYYRLTRGLRTLSERLKELGAV